MGNRYEALGLSISSDGPVGGIYSNSSVMNMSLMGDPKGIEHFTNWDSKISSLDPAGFERFESRHASTYLGHDFHASKIKICEDLAAVSYPTYTHIDKFVWENYDGGIYQPHKYDDETFYDMVIGYYYRMMDGFLLPTLNQFGLRLPPSNPNNDIEGFYDNLFLVIEYDGYFTGDEGQMVYDSSMDGGREVYRYDPPIYNEFGEYQGNNKTPGTFSFVPDIGHVVVYPSSNVQGDRVFGPSRYLQEGSAPEAGTLDDPRYHTPQVDNDIPLFSLSPDGSTWPAGGSTRDFLTNPPHSNGDLTYAFVGYKKISIIKYSPVIECGRVDLYHRKFGNVSSFTNLGTITSFDHKLKDGDMIKIVGALGESEAIENVNGIKYVQINDEHTFTIYQNKDFSERVDLSLVRDSDIKWVLLGSSNGSMGEGWEFKTSIFSPHGKNGVHDYSIALDELNTDLTGVATPILFNEAESYSEILEKDIGYSFIHPSFGNGYWLPDAPTDIINSNMVVGSTYSARTALWAGPRNYLSGYRFGSDIDLVKNGNNFSLIVGECGPDRLVRYEDENHYYNLPDVAPYGKAHLINIVLESNKDLTITTSQTIYAHTDDTEISQPPEITNGNFSLSANFYVGMNVSSPSLTYPIATLNKSSQEKGIRNSFVFNGGYISNDYWRGAMLYHLPQSRTNQFMPPDNFIFSDVALYEFGEEWVSSNMYFAPYALDFTLTQNPDGSQRLGFYPYIDNFGKSVAIEVIDGKVIVAVGSTVKTQNDQTISSGYVHVFDMSTLSKINKLDGGSMGSIIEPIGWMVHYHPSRRFAQCLLLKEGQLFYGRSKYEMAINLSVFNPGILPPDKSKIFHYRWNGVSYEYVSDIVNVNDTDLLTQPSYEGLNYKERKLRGKEISGGLSNTVSYISDRFGDFFSYDKGVLAANCFDLKNDIGQPHDDRTVGFVQPGGIGAELLCDYINVYEIIKNKWVYVSKISATIDSAQSRYAYEDILFPRFYGSLRRLNNLSYNQTRENSATWDMDLTNCFVVADHRVILKDPIGYSIFSKDWNFDIESNIISTNGEDIIIPGSGSPQIPVFPYFSYSENFIGYETVANVLHTKIEQLYKYENQKTVRMFYNPFIRRIEHFIPVYFMSIPNDVGVINNLFVRATFNTSNIFNARMVVYRIDPRLTVYPNDNYISYTGGYTPEGDIPGDFYLVNREATAGSEHNGQLINGQYVYKHGAFDASTYHLSTPEIDPQFAKIFNFEQILPNNTLEFRVGLSDLLQYKSSTSRLQDSIKEFQNLSINLVDRDRPTYDPTMEINDTLIIGFMIDFEPEAGYFIPFTSLTPPVGGPGATLPGQGPIPPGGGFSAANTDISLNIVALNSYIDNSIPDTIISGSSGDIILDNIYKCVSSNISTYFVDSYNQSSGGKLVYTNPVLGFGTSSAATHMDAENGRIYDGTFSSAYQLISADVFGQQAMSYEYYNISRSFDVQRMEYLPLHIKAATVEGRDLNLSIPSYFSHDNNVNLYTVATGDSGNINLFIQNEGINFVTDLIIFGSDLVNNNVNLRIQNNDVGRDLDLYIRAPEIINDDLDLYITGPTPSTQDMTLFTSVDDWKGADSDLNLVMYGNTVSSFASDSNVDLIISGGLYDSEYTNMPLVISAHGGPDSLTGGDMPLYIGYVETITPLNNNLSISIYNDQSVEENWVRKSGDMSLILNSTYGTEESMFLHISRKGPGGGEEYGDDLNINMWNTQAIENLPIFINSTYATDGSVNLFMPSGVGGINKDVRLFTRGFTE
jgi:hypothetical protein